MKQFELGQYKGLELACFDTTVKEPEVNEALDYLINNFEEIEREKKDEAIEIGDYIIINIEGLEKSTALPLVIENDCRVEVGGESLMPEMTVNLLGKKKGDIVVFDKKIGPELIDFQHLWGRELEFKLEVKSVMTMEKPELTEDIIREIAPGIKTLRNLKRKIKEEIHCEKKEKVREANVNILFEALIAHCRYEFDEESLDLAAEDLYNKFAEELKNVNDIELLDYLIGRKITTDELLMECKEEAAKRIIREQILDAVIARERILLTMEEKGRLEERIRKGQENGQISELFNDFDVVKTHYLRRKAIDFLLNVNMIS